MSTYSICKRRRRDPTNPSNSWGNIVTETEVFEGTITQARKEAYRISREETIIQVEVRYPYDHALIGYIVGKNAPGNENLWMVPDDRKPLGIRPLAIDASGRVREIWGN